MSTNTAVPTPPTGAGQEQRPQAGPQAPRPRSAAAKLGRRATEWLRGGPMSVTLAVLVALAPLAAVDGVSALTYAGNPLGLLPALVWTPNALMWLLAIVTLLGVGPIAERTLGPLRTLVIGLSGHVTASLAVLAVAWSVRDWIPLWGHLLGHTMFGGPWMWIISILVVASLSWPGLWRRRLLAVLVPVSVTAAAFGGSPQEVGFLAALGFGWVVGLGVARDERRSSGRRAPGEKGERRFIIAAAVAGVAVGVLFSAGSSHLVGPLSGTRFLMAPPKVTPDELELLCSLPREARRCAQATFANASSGPGSLILAAIPLVLQLILADGLRRGRHAAWVGTLALQGLFAALAFAHLASAALTFAAAPHDASRDAVAVTRLIMPVLVPVALAVAVSLFGNLFPVKVRPKPARALAAWVAGSGLAAVVAFAAVALLVPDQFAGDPVTLGRAVGEGAALLLPSAALAIVSPALYPVGPVALAATQLIPLVPWGGLVVCVWRLLREATPDDPHVEFGHIVADRGTASASLAWMGTWEGNRVWTAPAVASVSAAGESAVAERPAGESGAVGPEQPSKAERPTAGESPFGPPRYVSLGAVAYQTHLGVALTVGDPVSSESDLEAVTHGFLDYCEHHSLIPALYSVHEPTARIARELGWTLAVVADEALLPLGEVEFRGKKFQDLRTAQNRAKKEGIEARWTTWDECSAHARRQIRALSEQWLGDKGLPEMGFTLGGVDQMADPHVRLLIAVDGEETVHGVTSWMPIYDGGEVVGLTLDFMRKTDAAFRPTIEFLLARAILEAQEEGLKVLSLSGAPLAHDAGEAPDAIARLLTYLGGLLEPVYGFRSLHAFKEKFAPQYAPMYLCVRDAGDLPLVGAALGRAYVPSMSTTDALRVTRELIPQRAKSSER